MLHNKTHFQKANKQRAFVDVFGFRIEVATEPIPMDVAIVFGALERRKFFVDRMHLTKIHRAERFKVLSIEHFTRHFLSFDLSLRRASQRLKLPGIICIKSQIIQRAQNRRRTAREVLA
jgi:hypothetical protein